MLETTRTVCQPGLLEARRTRQTERPGNRAASPGSRQLSSEPDYSVWLSHVKDTSGALKQGSGLHCFLSRSDLCPKPSFLSQWKVAHSKDCVRVNANEKCEHLCICMELIGFPQKCPIKVSFKNTEIKGKSAMSGFQLLYVENSTLSKVTRTTRKQQRHRAAVGAAQPRSDSLARLYCAARNFLDGLMYELNG